jgi:S-adenosylmethionine synthetase
MEKNPAIKRVTNLGVMALLDEQSMQLRICIDHIQKLIMNGESTDKVQQEISLFSKYIKSLTDGLNLLDLQEN